MPEDRFGSAATGTTSPAFGAFAITPHATNELPRMTRALYVGGSGNATVVFADGTELLLTGLVAGQVYPFRLSAVRTSGTTATALVGLD